VIELHCHIDGLPIDPIHGLPVIDSFEAWVRWQEAAEPHLTPRSERLPPLLEQHAHRLKAQGVVYAEIFVSGLLAATEDLGALVEIFRRLRPEITGLRLELVACVGRGSPAKLERQLPKILALHEAKQICGVALAGDELKVPVRALASCFDRFHERGMGIEIHAGEQGGADSVRDALTYGHPDRIGHGVAAFRDPALLDEIRARGVHLEMCPTSNLKLGVVPRIEEHPIGRAFELGLEFSVNTDDPGPFGCSMASEIELVRRTFGWDDSHLSAISQSARKAAFAGR
jgi:adenosine deaminase